MIRLLLVEDHAPFREALTLAFAQEPDISIVGEAGSLLRARAQLEGVDVALVDLDLPDGDGTDLIPDLHRLNRRCAVLLLTASAGVKDLTRAVDAGAAGLLHKTAPVTEIIGAIRRLHRGELLVLPGELVTLTRLAREKQYEDNLAQEAIKGLTPRERDVLHALGEGLSDKEMALRLGVSSDTIHTHTVNLLWKLGVETRLQALIFAVRHGMLPRD